MLNVLDVVGRLSRPCRSEHRVALVQVVNFRESMDLTLLRRVSPIAGMIYRRVLHVIWQH